MTTTERRLCGAKVKALREQRQWTQEQLAKNSGYSLRSIQRAEAGVPVKPQTVRDLATVFQVEPEFLMTDTPLDEAAKKRMDAIAAKILFLHRFTKGRDLLEFVGTSDAYLFSHDEPTSAEEAEQIGGFLQGLQDWGEAWSDVGQGDRVKHGFDMTASLAELAAGGLWVFGARKHYGVRAAGGKDVAKLSAAVVMVARATSPKLVLGDDPANAVLPTVLAEDVGVHL
jgi:transcriptional regulator with XRE-family HTH domain